MSRNVGCLIRKANGLEQQLRGYRLRGETYKAIQDGRSELLQLRLVLEGRLIGFYREDTGEKLLIPDELVEALRQEVAARQQAEERAEQAQLQIEQLKARLRRRVRGASRREAACR